MEANSVQSPFLPEARWIGTGRLPFHPHTRPHSSPGQPTLTPTSIAPPDVSLAPAHSPLVLQCRRRAHSVHVTSLAGEDPTKLDPDISVYPTGHGKRSDVQINVLMANVQMAQETEGRGEETIRIYWLS